MSGKQEAGLDLLRNILVALSSDEASTPSASKARMALASSTARARAMWAREMMVRQRSSKKHTKVSIEPRGAAGGAARSARHPMRKVELEFQNFFEQECRKDGWNRYSAGKFAGRMAKAHGVNARHVAEQARKWAKKKTRMQRAK